MSRHGLLLRTFVAGLTFVVMGVCLVALQPTQAKEDEPFEVVKTEEFEGVIIPREKASDFMKAFSGLEEKESWTPVRADVLKLEKGIEAFLKKAAPPKGSKDLWTKISTYKRQYIGVMRKGRKVIFVNFFCDAFNSNWKAVPVAVEDGGDCFFNVLYDPASTTFSDLRINGEA